MWSTLHQQKYGMTIPRDEFLLKLVYSEELSKKELRVALLLLTELEGLKVALLLLTELEGLKPKDRNTAKDPSNFRRIDPKHIAIDLGLKKKDVQEIIDRLVELEILEEGEGASVKHGYRFTF